MINNNFCVKKNKKLKGLVLLILTLIIIMFPTSINGQLMEIPKVIIYGYAIMALILFPTVNKKKIFISAICTILIVFFTLISNGSILGVTQFIPLLSFFIIMSIEYNKIYVSERALSIGLSFLLLTIIFFGYLVIYDNQIVISSFVQFYTYGYKGLAEAMYSNNKPISFFISHAIAAIAYAILFFIAIFWGKYTNKKYFFLLAILLIPLIISLASNTSYLSLFIIFTYIFFLLKNKYKVLYLCIAIFTVYYFKDIIIELDLSLDFFLGNSNNGFLSRYDSNEGVYAVAFKQIVSSPFIGTGLLFSEGQYKADSGIINELLRGGIIYLLLIKYLMYLTIFKSTNNKKISIMVVAFFMIMEIAYAFTLSLRGPVLMMLILIYLNHIYQNKSIPSDK